MTNEQANTSAQISKQATQKCCLKGGLKHSQFSTALFYISNIMVQVSSEYISIGCNRTAHAACWGNNGLVAFGADTLVALYSPLVRSMTCSFFSKACVNAVSCCRIKTVKAFKRRYLDIKVVLFA